MKRIVPIQTLLFLFIAPLLLGMTTPLKMTDAGWRKHTIQIEAEPNLDIHEGYVSQKEETVLVKRGRRIIAKVFLSEPVTVAMAEQEERWGFFQFPEIYRNEENNLIVAWQMGEDSFKAYGEVGSGRMMSKNEGKTWQHLDKDYFHKSSNRVEMKNGDILQDNTPAARDIKIYRKFPRPINKEQINNCYFYYMSDLPDELQGAYLRRLYSQKHTSEKIHVSLEDPELLRFSQEGLIPVLWLGGIKELENGSLLAGVYPNFYLNKKREVLASSISFYQSFDNGFHWTLIGNIPCQTLGDNEPQVFQLGEEGFTEPTFEFLKDSVICCVMRSGTFRPLYKCYSTDLGHHWTKPDPITSNGVKPRLLKLGNGIIVLSSGRPGVQLRFSIDGDGNSWTKPIEMLPFMDKNDSFPRSVSKWETCGYTGLLAVDNNTFYIVYSDFRTKNKDSEERKSIMFRKVVIKRKKSIFL